LEWRGKKDRRIFTALSHHSTDDLHGQCATDVGTVNRNRDPPTFGVSSLVKNTRSCFFGRKWPIYVTAAGVWSRTRLPIIQSATKREEHLPVVRREAVPDRLKQIRHPLS